MFRYHLINIPFFPADDIEVHFYEDDANGRC